MKHVEIYTSSTCPFCIRAKALLDQKSISYEEISVDGKPDVRAKMTERAGGKTSVPQIFIAGNGIGGCDDLHALEAAGKLDSMLG